MSFYENNDWERAFNLENSQIHFYILNLNPFWKQEMAAKSLRDKWFYKQVIIFDIRSFNI